MPDYSLSAGPSSCTICGKHYYDRSAFNAHIRAHLKEKLRRKTDTGSVTCPPSPAANSPQQVALHLPSSPKQAKMETNQHTQIVMSPGIKVEPHAPDLLQPSFTKQQVWPLTQFFSVSFCENSLICLKGKSMTPHRGNTILFRSSQQLPRLRLGLSKGFMS